MKYVITIALLLLFCAELFAQRQVITGKTITSKEIWSGTVIIEGDVEIAPDALLTIEPGTRILFKPQSDARQSGQDKTRSELIVKGRLTAKGELGNNIFFSSYSEDRRMGDWYGIVFLSPKQMSIMDFCVVEYAFNGISIKKSSPMIRNSQIRLNYNAGIVAEVKATPRLLKNIISENGYAGIIASLGAKPVLSQNLISLNQIGVIAFSMAQPNLGNTAEGDDYNEGKNRIFDNAEFDLYNHTSMTLLAENNFWGGSANRELIAERIYDGNDEQRYGQIDVEPILGETNLDELIRLSQASPEDNRLASQNAQPGETGAQQGGNNTAQTPPGPAEEITAQNRSNPAGTTGTDGNTLTPQDAEDAENVPAEANTEQSAARQNNNPQLLNTPPSRLENPASENALAQADNDVENVPINYDQIFLETFLDEKREVLRKRVPQVTDPSLSQFKGKVIIRAVVSKDGRVENASVIRGINPYLDRLAMESAREFRFRVGTIKGVPVRFYTNLVFEFN